MRVTASFHDARDSAGHLGFLVDIYSDMADNAARIGSEKWREFAPAGITTVDSLATWDHPYQASPAYSPPTAFDTEELLSMAGAQLNHASDEMWLCQTDPAYMKRTMRECKISEKCQVRPCENSSRLHL